MTTVFTGSLSLGVSWWIRFILSFHIFSLVFIFCASRSFLPLTFLLPSSKSFFLSIFLTLYLSLSLFLFWFLLTFLLFHFSAFYLAK